METGTSAHSPNGRVRVINIDEAERTAIDDRGVSLHLVDEAVGATNVDVHINVLRAGTEGPYHFHERAENIYIVLAGTADVFIEGEHFVAGPDQVLFIPPGVRHSVRNPGPGLLKLVEVYSPPAYPHDFNVVGEDT